MNSQQVIPVWQPQGYSTHIISKKVSEKYKAKTSHTGTLDPMAEGVIIILLDEERLKKKEYAEWKKTYEFEIAFGISTDTFDGMGLIGIFDHKVMLKRMDIEEILPNFIGKYRQIIPIFSTKKVAGLHLHEYARNGMEIDLPIKCGVIYEIRLLDFYEESLTNLVENIVSKIDKVSGDFRQEKIEKSWENILRKDSSKKKIQIAKITVEISKGMYIRSLSQDICTELSVPGFVSNLVRTKNGNFDVNNSKTLESIFGNDFEKQYDFHSNYSL